MTKSFNEWRDEQRNKVDGYTERDAYEAGQQSKQAEVDGVQLKLSDDSRVLHNVIDIEKKKCEELQNKYDAMYKAFTVADDCRKEWHRCYVGIRQREDELQKRIGDAIYDLQHIESAMWEEQVEHVLRILKGNKNDH